MTGLVLGIDRLARRVAALVTVLAALAIATTAHAACTPPAVDATNPGPGSTVVCSGVTTDQNGAAGYGTGSQTAITIDINPGATVTGTVNQGVSINYAVVNNAGAVAGAVQGIESQLLATVNNSLGASILGGLNGVVTNNSASIVNSGTITGTADAGVFSALNIDATNNAGATISGGQWGLQATTTTLAQVTLNNSGVVLGNLHDGVSSMGPATVTNSAGATIFGGEFGVHVGGDVAVNNSGSIYGTSKSGVSAGGKVTIDNFAGATISGGRTGVLSASDAKVANFGSIIGTSEFGVRSDGAATVANLAGALISGGMDGITSDSGSVNVNNLGTITGGSVSGIEAHVDAIVSNKIGANIFGGGNGIVAGLGSVQVFNAGSIAGGVGAGLYAVNSDATLINAATGSVGGALYGVRADSGGAVVINSGSIVATGSAGLGVYARAATVTNDAGATIFGGDSGVFAGTDTATVTNSGTITGNASSGVYGAGGVDVTNNAGTISGGLFGIAVDATSAGSTVFNAGTISGGTAAIRFGGTGNTLTLAPTSVITGNVLGTGADTFQLGGSGSGTFDVSAVAPAGQYQGFGTFNKIGDSNWTLTGTSSFVGPVNVNGGTLSVNGNIASAGNLTVNAGGTLGGTGVVGNTTVNGGALAPGNSIGTLTVKGNLVFTTAASYMVEVSPAAADRTNVSGSATLAGATVRAAFAPGAYVAKQYTILNAAGGINGSFGSLVNSGLPVGFVASLSYDPANVYLNLTLGLSQYAGLNVNQQNVADALVKSFNANGGIPAVFATLTPAGLTQVSGEHATRVQQATFDAMGLFTSLLTDPVAAGRGEPVASAASNFAGEQATSGASRNAYAAHTKAMPARAPFEPHWSVWGTGFGGSRSTDGDAVLGSHNATDRIAGGAVGADYRLSPATVAGFALAGGATSFSVDGLGSGRSDLFQAGGSVRHHVGAAFLAGAAAYGWQDVTLDRTLGVAGLDRLKANFKANAYSGRLEGGYRYATGWMAVIPYAAGQFMAVELPAYAERTLAGANTFALNYASKTATSTRSELGVRTEKAWAMNDAILTLRGRAAWTHEFDTERSLVATFQTLPLASFTVNGAKPAADAALATASAEMAFSTGISLAATFEGEFSGVTRSYAGKGVARYTW